MSDVQRFFAGKHITHCSVCNHYDWQLETDATSLNCDRSASSGSNIDVIVLVCKNCGALHFHALSVVAKWLECHRAHS